MNNVYTLTPMTGREASAARTVVIGTVEINFRVWMILLWSSPIGLLLTLILWPFLAELALVAFPLVSATAVFLVHRRSTTGMRLRTYQSIWDKRKAQLDTFYLCGEPIEVTSDDFHLLGSNTVTMPRRLADRDDDAALNDMFGGAA